MSALFDHACIQCHDVDLIMILLLHIGVDASAIKLTIIFNCFNIFCYFYVTSIKQYSHIDHLEVVIIYTTQILFFKYNNTVFLLFSCG